MRLNRPSLRFPRADEANRRRMTGRRYSITKQTSHCSRNTPSPRHTDDLSLKNSLRMRSSSGMRSEKNFHPAQLSQVKNQQRSLAGASRPGLRVPLKRSLPRIRRTACGAQQQRAAHNRQRATRHRGARAFGGLTRSRRYRLDCGT